MPGRTAAGDELYCPACGATYGEPERFCPDCKLPLVHGGGVIESVGERHERARKVKPQFTEGRLVRGASFPFGPVTPQATCSSGTGPRSGEISTEWTPS